MLSQKVKNPKKWTAETPNLYTLILTAKVDNKVVEITSTKIGFRQVELKNGHVLVNGKKIFVRGVNRHDYNPDTGHYITVEEMEKDILSMKRLNMNSVRTAHYPNDVRFYDAC